MVQLPSITVYEFSLPRHREWQHLINASPPCTELVTWLRIAGIPYEKGLFPPPLPPPKGKFPFIVDGDKTVADTAAIIDWLVRSRGVDPDDGLTAQERAIGVAFRRLAKENLYWVIIHHLWRDPACWAAYSTEVVPQWVGGDTPEETAARVSGLRKLILDQLHGQGMGRHSADEVYQIGIVDLTAIADFLSQKAFFFGDKPTTTDAAIYAHVTHFLDMPVDSPPARFIRGQRNLTAYCQRMRATLFADLPPR